MKNTTWKQKLESDKSLKQTIQKIFDIATEKHKTHSEILNELKRIVYSEEKYKTLPNYMKYGIRCYVDAFFDIQETKVEWAHWYNGEFVKNKLPYGDDFNQNLVESSFVYKGTQYKY